MGSLDYKTAKELFVSDTKGSTITHINLISVIAFSSLFLYTALRTHLPHFPPSNSFLLFWSQFVLLVLPLLGAVTYAAHDNFDALKWNVVMAITAVVVCLRFDSKRRAIRETIPTSSPDPAARPEFPSETALKKLQQQYSDSGRSSGSIIPPLPAVSTWRAHMMLMTVMCILAVDFPVFPRALAKCEAFGVSLMDLGVGSFVFAQGVASALPLIREPDHLTKKIGPKIWISIKKTSPLLAIALIRLLLVKATDYPGEHISEYGTHWNFFITLALIPPLQMSLQPLFRYLPISFIGLFVSFAHQAFLTYCGLQSWTFNSPRTNIINHNKEGLASLLGYLSIHLLGLSIGLVVFPPSPSHFGRKKGTKDHPSDSSSDEEAYAKDAWIDETKKSPRKSERDDGKTAIELCSYGVLYLLIFVFMRLIAREDDVSRVLANSQYVLWVTSFNIFFLLLYIVHDIFFFPSLSRKPRATDMAAQLGPTAPATNDAWATSTSTSHPRPSLTLSESSYDGTVQSHSPGRSGSRQGFLSADDALADGARPELPKRRKSARRSWEGSDLDISEARDAPGMTPAAKAEEWRKRLGGVAEGKYVEEGQRKSSPELLEAINKNGLVIFLLANVLTGLINLGVETIYMPDGTALAILSGYLLVLCAFAWAFRRTKILRL